MIVLLTFATVVLVAVSVFAWVARAQSRYMSLRLERLGEWPPLADPAISAGLSAKPWLWPVRVGPIWRAQTRYDQSHHADSELNELQRTFRRRQRIAVGVYLLGIVATLASTLVHV